MITEVLTQAVKDVLKTLSLEAETVRFEHPEQSEHGDYATNVALALAKQAGKNPRELADSIAAELTNNLPENVSKVEVAGPGFINFYLTQDFFTEAVKEVLKQGENYGKNETLKNEEVLFEYTSPNLFKPLHVGNLVGNIVGESISRLFEFSGAEVRRINYPSDIGLTVAKGVWGLQKTGGNPENILELGEAYRAGNEAYENDEDAKKDIDQTNKELYAGTNDVLSELRTKGIETSRARLAELCAQLGTTFDFEIFESQAGPIGHDLVHKHIKDGIFEVSEGATIFKGEKHGLHTRVFLNSQDLPTYEAKDLGNFTHKNNKYPNWTQSFVVTGNEQREYFKVIIAALREVFPEAKDKVIEHISTGFLTLSTGKMSSRKGNVLTGESLIEDMKTEAQSRAREGSGEKGERTATSVAVAALKYQILKHGIGTDMVFDKERALSLEGDSGVYLQYANTRAQSVLRKASVEGFEPNAEVGGIEAGDIERLLYQFPELVQNAHINRAPHTIVTYLTELAGAFNRFYAQGKIIDETNQEVSAYKLAVTQAFAHTMKNGLWLLGIEAPEEM